MKRWLWILAVMAAAHPACAQQMGVRDFIAAAKTQKRAPLEFEAASIHPTDPKERGQYMLPRSPVQNEVFGTTLKVMIWVVYRVTPSQVAGGPDWIDKERWNIIGKAARPSSRDQLAEMFETLLANRFQLKFHIESRKLPALVLTVAKPGKLKVNTANLSDFDRLPIRMTTFGKFSAEACDIPYFTWWMASNILHQPVINRTNLTEKYDFNVQFDPRLTVNPDDESSNATALPSPYSAFKDQLGLKLSRGTGAVDVIVIDHAEKPSN